MPSTTGGQGGAAHECLPHNDHWFLISLGVSGTKPPGSCLSVPRRQGNELRESQSTMDKTRISKVAERGNFESSAKPNRY